MPRAGAVNARRPGHWPGRSEAESIDDAEHGASIICAMVARLDLRARPARVLPKNQVAARNPSLRTAQTHVCAQVLAMKGPCGRRGFPAQTGHADSDTGYGQRWRERPRQGTLRSGGGHGSGVVHAIVPAVTSAWTSSGESAQSAASLSSARQLTPRQAVGCGSRSSPTKGEREPGAGVERGGPT